jgi:chemotaxis protein methyltransferase CheR
MGSSISSQEFKILSDYIEKVCGIHLEPEKMYLVESRLTVLMAENGCATYADLYKKASAEAAGTLRDKIIDAMATNETLWFRDSGPYEILRDLLNGYASEIKSGKRSKIRIWCCACSTGQEPYSIAMTALESGRQGSGLRPEHFEILATDISSTVLFLAKLGRYDQIAINRGLTADMRDRYFKSEGRIWKLGDNVRNMVTFKRMNLQESYSWIGSRDIIFCRNVLIYFSEEFKRDIFSRVASLLRPAGFLFVGASESVSSYSGDFAMLKHTRGLYYQVK